MLDLRLLFLLLVLAGAGPVAEAQDAGLPETSPLTDDLRRDIDAFFEGVDEFSGNVLVALDGDVLYSRSFGHADRELGVPNTVDTKFRIGSITKPFTAVAVLRLAEQGRLALSDSVSRFLPGLPEDWAAITVHQLLSHTAGLGHTWGSTDFEERKRRPADVDEVLAWYMAEPMVGRPGEGFNYSGIGYFVLARVIEAVSGKTYAAYLADEVFAPAGMTASGADDPRVVLSGRAEGYVYDSTGVRHADYFHVPVLSGGGNLYSTVHDLLAFDRALRENRIMSQANTERMFTPVEDGYGYGWDIVETDTLDVRFHTGHVPGFLSRFDIYPESGLCLIVLTNDERSTSPLDTWEITRLIFRALEQAAPVQPSRAHGN